MQSFGRQVGVGLGLILAATLAWGVDTAGIRDAHRSVHAVVVAGRALWLSAKPEVAIVTSVGEAAARGQSLGFFRHGGHLKLRHSAHGYELAWARARERHAKEASLRFNVAALGHHGALIIRAQKSGVGVDWEGEPPPCAGDGEGAPGSVG